MECSKYWELNTFQKAALTYEEIQAFRKVELMVKGVAIPQEPSQPANPPTFDEFAKGHETTITAIQFGYSTEYQIDDADVEKLLSVQFRRIESKYVNSQSIRFLGNGERPEIVKRTVYPEFSSLHEKYNLLHGDAVKRKKEWETYQNQLNEAAKATQDLIADWEESQDAVSTYCKVKKVFSEFVEMTEGDHSLARKFLEKQFDHEVIDTYEALSSIELGADPFRS